MKKVEKEKEAVCQQAQLVSSARSSSDIDVSRTPGTTVKEFPKEKSAKKQMKKGIPQQALF
jgi:hypothetical protein